MRWPEFIKFAKETKDKYPELGSKIYDIVAMAKDEIADGGSEDNECELGYSDIQELIKE
jgi:hypothetical protein